MKHRLRNKTDNEWVKHFVINQDGTVGLLSDDQGTDPYSLLYEFYDDIKFSLDRSSECFDRDGVEIFENDIVSYKGQVGTVSCFAGIFIASYEDQLDDEIGYMTTKDLKVIGNIYETDKRTGI